jgi:Protein of unknown function (DUF664)
MTPPRIRPPLGADERTQLVGWLDLQRAIAAWKCEGLSEEDAHRSVLPTSPHGRHPRASRRPEGLLLTGPSVRGADRKPGHGGPPGGSGRRPSAVSR